ncbi:ABC-three component system protein [Actinomadura chokoriensis]|uniref:ABC-three component system protein n=1 Tax=Actinomadura chokoriensis TaxID=454156 RepID=UPI0031FA2D5C
MFHRLGSDDERFKTLHFEPGLNLVLAERAHRSTETDSRNGTGKTSMVELLHFLLGATTQKTSLWAHKALKRHVFELIMDWPGGHDLVRIRRGPATPKVFLRPDVTRRSQGERLWQEEFAGEISLKEWQWAIERDLYRVPSPESPLSGRTMLSFAMRRGLDGLLSPTGTHARQSPHDAMLNLSHLFGLDVGLAEQYRTLATQDSTRKKLVQATKDPVWGKIVGRSAELRGEIGAVEQRVLELQEQVKEFRVLPEYENIRAEADELEQAIRRLRDQDTVDRHNLLEMREAAADVAEPGDHYLEEAYGQLGVLMGREVRRRFEDVRAFHQTVVSNRERQLREEVARVEERLAERARERERLGERQSALLTMLSEGGALDALTALQHVLAQEQARVEALRHRFQAAQTLEASRREIDGKRIELETATAEDLEDRAALTYEANRLFNIYARRLYSDARTPYLAFTPTKQRMQIEAHIDTDNSRGVHNMVIFCFDLALTVLAHRGGRGPDFLVHDSHLYDGVDARQLAAALTLGAEVADEEGLQYIVTMNSDDLSKAESAGFGPASHVLEPHLTDQPDGGLFGFRF